MSKLFALENLDENIDEVELEVSPEEGESAAVQQEVEADVAEVSQMDSAIDEGTEAADQLEEVEELIEGSLEEDGEGLNEVAAEAIRVAVEAICSKVGANPKTMSVLYATENFRSASSRRANTQYALESVSEFLKNLWERIRSAISNLWSKIVDFWNKHASSLGRLLKALEAGKKRAQALQGNPSFDLVDVPAGLRNTFPVKGDLGEAEVTAYVEVSANAFKQIDQNFKVLEDASKTKALSEIQDNVVKPFQSSKGITIAFGDEKQPCAGGKYYKWNFKSDVVETLETGDKVIAIEVDEDHGEFTDGRAEAQLRIIGKDKLKAILTDSVNATKGIIKYRDKAESRARKVNDTLKAISSSIAKLESKDPKAHKKAQSDMRVFQLIMTKGPQLEARAMSIFVATMRGVLAYADACMKNHKK